MPIELALTDEQRSVVTAPIGHYLITAVAGSGKTTTLAYRIRHLLEQNTDPRRLLVLMFNRAAQQDFSARLNQVLPPDLVRPEVRTFHAMGYRLYQRFVRDGYLPPFNSKILSEKEAQIQLWRLARIHAPSELQNELTRNKKEHLELATRFIDAVKSQLHGPEIVFEELELEAKFSYFLALFDAFEAWRKQQQRISYADMLYDTVHAIAQRPELQALVSNKMDIVLVDEYQDTNDIQHALLKYIAGNRAAVTVVGDPDQTIYEFRGAKPEYMLSTFEQQFPGTQQLNLSYSFRYGHAVSLLANHLISRNQGRSDILCHSHATTPCTLVQLQSSPNEAEQLRDTLQTFSRESLDQSAILLRVWSQSISFELAFLAAGIPYQMAEHKGVLASEELKALRALLELANGNFSQMSAEQRQVQLFCLMRFPHLGIPESSMQQIAQQVSQQPAFWGQALSVRIPSELKKFQVSKFKQFAQTLHSIETQNFTVPKLFAFYIKNNALFEGIRSMSLNHDFAEEKVASIQAMMNYLNRCAGSTHEVLDHLDRLQEQSHSLDKSGILLSTIHRAKGLEWSQVFIPGFNERHYPYSLRSEQIKRSELESERRLLYVAMTRAKQHLHLIGPRAHSEIKSSRFEAELQWPCSSDLAKALNAGAGTASLNKITRIATRYAAAANPDLVLASKTPPQQHSQARSNKQKPKASHSSEQNWQGKRVDHNTLGQGEVIAESAQAFTVKFDHEDQVRDFSKSYAERFFIVLG